VQRGLLKLMEETEVPLRTPFDLASQLQAAMEFQSKGKISQQVINTRHILFIVSGAFNGLADIIRKRIGAKQIGFTGPAAGSLHKEEDHFQYVKSTDFIEYGFESEFVGRLPVVVSCQTLDVEDLFRILKHAEGSIIRQYEQAFKAYGIELVFTDEGLHRIAEKAYQEQTGARSLVSVCERTFREFKFHLPASPVRRLEVTSELVDSPTEVLENILLKAESEELASLEKKADEIAAQWSERYGISIRLAPGVASLAARKATEKGQPLEEFFAETLRNYEHGLSLIRKTRGIDHFEITSDVIEDPAATLDRWIRSYYIRQQD
jgi:ATP-dependent protease Clp ATPase subunit